MLIALSDREFHTTLAALRYWQHHVLDRNIPPSETIVGDIADECKPPMATNEVSAFCERINGAAGRSGRYGSVECPACGEFEPDNILVNCQNCLYVFSVGEHEMFQDKDEKE